MEHINQNPYLVIYVLFGGSEISQLYRRLAPGHKIAQRALEYRENSGMNNTRVKKVLVFDESGKEIDASPVNVDLFIKVVFRILYRIQHAFGFRLDDKSCEDRANEYDFLCRLNSSLVEES